ASDSPPPTLRVDYFHTGNAQEERFALDRVVLEPLRWPGMPARAIDETNLGKYFFEVVDRVTRRVLYSRGFASVYGEWEPRGEAAAGDRPCSVSVRFPRAAAAVEVVVKKRHGANDSREDGSLVVGGDEILVEGSAPASAGEVI